MFWGLGSQVLVLKVGVPNVGYESAPQGEAPGFEFPQDCGSQGWGEVSGEILSQPLLPSLVWFPLHLPDVKGSLYQFLGFIQRRFSIYSCTFPVSLEGGEFRIFLCRHLESFFFFFFHFKSLF